MYRFIILEEGSVKKKSSKKQNKTKKVKVMLHWVENICISSV